MAKRKPVERKDGEPYVPATLQDAIVYFADPDRAHAFAVMLRWPDGVFCPWCDSAEHLSLIHI